MDDFVMPLVLGLDISSLTMSLVSVASPPGEETGLADSVEQALRPFEHLRVARSGNTVTARTDLGHPERVVVVAQLDSAAVEADPLAYVEMGKLFGPGASDAKGALAVVLKAAALDDYARDVTFAFTSSSSELDTDVVGAADAVLFARPTGCAVRGDALDDPLVRQLIALTEVDPVARPAAYGPNLELPAVAFGPGDPSLAGRPDEFVPTAELAQGEFVLGRWLTQPAAGAVRATRRTVARR